MNDVIAWLSDGGHWSGGEGIWLRLWEHLLYSGIALGLASLVAVPLGLVVGHTGRGRFLAVNVTGAFRAIPSLGLLFVGIMLISPRLSGEASVLVPTEIVLTVLAIPPILAGAYAGVEQVDAGARDAAKGMGMTGAEVLWRVEVPCATPLIASGLRSAALQVIATATLAATVGLGGLGRYLIDGLSVRDYAQMASGALLVAALALAVDLAASLLQRLVVSPGLSGNAAGEGRLSAQPFGPRGPDERHVPMKRTPLIASLTTVALLGLAGCGGGEEALESDSSGDSGDFGLGLRRGRRRVGELPRERPARRDLRRCAQRRRRRGLDQLNIGSREVYIPAIEDASIDILPEYTGVLRDYFLAEEEAGAVGESSDSEGVYSELRRRCPRTSRCSTTPRPRTRTPSW